MVGISRRTIVAIGKHITAQNSLSGRHKGIRVEESADDGVIVAGLAIIKFDVVVVVVTTVADGVLFGYGSGVAYRGSRGGEQLAVGIISIAGNRRAGGVDDSNNVTLQIEDIIAGVVQQPQL